MPRPDRFTHAVYADVPRHDARACLFAAALWGLFCIAALLLYAGAFWIVGALQ